MALLYHEVQRMQLGLLVYVVYSTLPMFFIIHLA